jgi:hypothetical protein
MKAIVERNDQASALSQWYGADAKVWMFHVTHKRMAIRLSRKDEAEVLYIVAVGCERISGPLSWKEASVSIALNDANSSCSVEDPRADFILLCSDAIVIRASAMDFNQSFDGFLEDYSTGADPVDPDRG